MTSQERDCHDRRTIERINAMFRVDERLCRHTETIEVSVENAAIVLRGELPSANLKSELVPLVRRAGVLGQICDLVSVGSPAAGALS